MTSPSLALGLHSLKKSFPAGFRKPPTTVVHELSFDVKAGEAFGLLGPNGAGKTTSLHMILGLAIPTAGTGTMWGRPLGDLEALRRVGYMPESLSLYEFHTPRSLLSFFGSLYGMAGERLRARIDAVIDQVRLTESMNASLSKFSKGMIQRLGLAQALLHEPDLLILDEPTSNLDPIGRKEIKDLLLAYKAAGKTILISSHVLGEVESLCDRVGILTHGTLAKMGALHELMPAQTGSEIKSKDVPAEAVAALKQLGATVAVLEGLAVIRLADKGKEFEAIQILQAHRCPLLTVTTQGASLEEIFFSTVQGSSR